MKKYEAKQRQILLPFLNRNNEVFIYIEKFYINKCIIKLSNEVKDIDIKNCTYYISNVIINIKSFDQNKSKINEKSYKNILVH